MKSTMCRKHVERLKIKLSSVNKNKKENDT